MKSIRKSLVISIVSGLLLLAILSGVLAFSWARHSLTRQLDAILAAKARALANLVEDENGETHFEFSDDNMPEFLSKPTDHYFQVWLPDGTILARSQSLGNHDLPYPLGTLQEPAAVAFQLHNGLNARAIGFQFAPVQEVGDTRFAAPAGAQEATIVVARDTRELDALLVRLVVIVLSFSLILPAASAIIVSMAVKRGLEPLNRLTKRVGDINVSTLKQRITEGENVVELQPITVRLNELLVRLDTAFARERRFTMDASHELRTPLAESRTALEVALKWPDDHELLVDSAHQALDATYQMEGIVTALLSFARADSDGAHGPLEYLSLRDILQGCWNQVNEPTKEKGLNLSISDGDVKSIYSNRTLLTAIITNLLSNAVQYSTPESTVTCGISDAQGEGYVTLRVCNIMETPLNEEDLEHLFEPLWRKDKSRTGDAGTQRAHSGLGLALVKAYCEKLGIQVHADIDNCLFGIQLQFTGAGAGAKTN